MSEEELELITMIRQSADPRSALATAEDIVRRFIAGEDKQSIAASYGIQLGAVG